MFHRPLPRTLQASLRDIDDPSERVRRSAISDLARHARGEVTPPVQEALQKALQDKDAMVRTEAAYALGDAHVVGALPALLMAIDDNHPRVRQAAIDSIGMLGDSRATTRLLRALHDERADVRFQAIIALGRVSPEHALDAIHEAAADDDPHVRYIAVRVCEELSTGPDASPGSPINLDPRLEEAALRWLTDIDEPVRVAAAILLARGGNLAGRSMLVRAVEGRVDGLDPEDGAASIELAGSLGLTETEPALVRMAFSLRSRLRRDAGSWMALVALARMGHQAARGQILGDLSAWSRDRRSAAVAAAGKARLADALPILQSMKGDDSRADPALVDEALGLLQASQPSGDDADHRPA